MPEVVKVITPDPGVVDEDNNPVGGPLASVEIEGCLVAPVAGTENETLIRNGLTTTVQVIFPLGTVVGARAELEIRGETYTVDGYTPAWDAGLEGQSDDLGGLVVNATWSEG
ncbi:hypothetical protein GYA93_15815 [Gordonia desulfuricans]|uniref:Head-to-tail stopper n=1 Tax=Gordonia desulfuricans TaxID=89051 RepID=A0A7K3LS19_9ACTN|nr:hypothetical protein [Gordonia desulfuricans]NDK91039.1 hypothetical protein [Gordonia desulfuricans]